MYLKAILRQDIAFFDMEMSAGQAVERMAGDTFLIQDAIGEKVLYIYICFEIIYYARGELQTDKLNSYGFNNMDIMYDYYSSNE